MQAARKKPKQPLDHEPEAVAYALDNSGLTMTQLAEMCGVSLSLISEIIAGTRNATPVMIGKLASALNCPRVVLERKREPKTAPAADVEVRALRSDERAVADDLPELRQVAGDA